MPNKPTDIERITHMIETINRISTYFQAPKLTNSLEY